MRPVNLIPPDERSGERKAMRGGPLAYVIVGALATAVIGVAVLTVTNNQISDSKAEIAALEEETQAVEAKTQALSAYTQFHLVSQQRKATVAGLANSRFDWERVMRELALILPSDVWLSNLTGSVNPAVSVEGSAGIALRQNVPGPALELIGCASSQDAVAGFVQALKEIDGVTRVGMQASELAESSAAAASSSSGSASCQTQDFIAQFQMVAAFDAAPATTTGSEAEEAEVAAPEATPASETSGE
jgi:Tfp pilus assembly protein PilN